MFKYFLYCVIFVTNIELMKSQDIEALKQKYAQIIMDCAQKFPIDQSDIEQLRSRQMPDKENVKCLFAYPSRLKKAEQFTDACKFVNDENVSDGSKGCERAALIFKCSVEKAAE
ncbi:unnamed protein product, partial [Leptidea sinapis]